jgi:hypothetical protein
MECWNVGMLGTLHRNPMESPGQGGRAAPLAPPESAALSRTSTPSGGSSLPLSGAMYLSWGVGTRHY